MTSKKNRVSFNHSIKLKDIKLDEDVWEKITKLLDSCQQEILLVIQTSCDVEIEHESIATLNASQVCLQVEDKRWFHLEK